MQTVAFRASPTGKAGKRRTAWRRPSKRLLSLAIAALSLLIAQPLAAQQITRIAILDLSRVLSYFSKEAAALKNFELKKAEVQAEVDRRTADIKLLQTKKSEAQAQGDAVLARITEDEIDRKTAELREYATARQNELDLLAKALSSGTSFLQKLNSTIAQVAESEGYSLVLNLKSQDQNANIVLWNSPSIDITDKVIQALAADH